VNVGVVGAGAIGTAIGARLALGGARVVLVGRPWLADRVRAGLALTRWGESAVPFPAHRVELATDVAAVAGCDVVFVATKSRDTRSAAASLREVLPAGTPVGSLQNGVHNADVLAGELPGRPIWPGMVTFNVVWAERRLHQGTSGPVVLPKDAAAVVALMNAGGCPARTHRDVRAVQWGKLLINLNNAVNALSGLPLRQMLLDRGYRRILADVVDEGRAVLRAAGIRARGVGRVQPALIPLALRLPDALFARAASAMVQVDPEARASMAEDLARGAPTEVDELNGEIVTRATAAGRAAPLNAGLVRLVHRAESEGLRPWSAGALAAELTRG
jgi:2-dehydropantoate 2-reductase